MNAAEAFELLQGAVDLRTLARQLPPGDWTRRTAYRLARNRLAALRADDSAVSTWRVACPRHETIETPAEAHVRGHAPDHVEIRESSSFWVVLDDRESRLFAAKHAYRMRWGSR